MITWKGLRRTLSLSRLSRYEMVLTLQRLTFIAWVPKSDSRCAERRVDSM